MSNYGYNPGLQRRARVGLDEAVLCGSKSVQQIETILNDAHSRGIRLLLTRLDAAQYEALPETLRALLDYDPTSLTAFIGGTPDDVRADVRHAMQCAKPGGRFILGASHSIAVGSNYDNFMTMLDEYYKHCDY